MLLDALSGIRVMEGYLGLLLTPLGYSSRARYAEPWEDCQHHGLKSHSNELLTRK
jgi:hypothetical protein